MKINQKGISKKDLDSLKEYEIIVSKDEGYDNLLRYQVKADNRTIAKELVKRYLNSKKIKYKYITG